MAALGGPAEACGHGLLGPMLMSWMQRRSAVMRSLGSSRLGRGRLSKVLGGGLHREALAQGIARIGLGAPSRVGPDIDAAVSILGLEIHAGEGRRGRGRHASAVHPPADAIADHRQLLAAPRHGEGGHQGLHRDRARGMGLAVEGDVGLQLEGDIVGFEAHRGVHGIPEMHVGGMELAILLRAEAAIAGADVVGALDQDAIDVRALGALPGQEDLLDLPGGIDLGFQGGRRLAIVGHDQATSTTRVFISESHSTPG